jgi:hypothetical protein
MYKRIGLKVNFFFASALVPFYKQNKNYKNIKINRFSFLIEMFSIQISFSIRSQTEKLRLNFPIFFEIFTLTLN